MTVVKIIKVLGTSSESWDDAVQEAVREASRTVNDIRGIEVQDYTADVDGDSITEYKATIDVAFPVHDKHQ